jgi:hypothetical protein
VAGRPPRGQLDVRVLIIGQAKTGTTALFYAVQAGLGIEHSVFEPEQLGFEEEHDDLIVKFIDNGRGHELIGRYDRSIILVRNGYDTLVSRLLFAPRKQLRRSSDRVLRAYVRKVHDVRLGHAGIVELSRCFEDAAGLDLVGALAADQRRLIRLAAERNQVSFVLTYEDFAGGRLAGLEAYLGAPIAAAPRVELPANHAYVTRSRRPDNWRGWISREDMDVLEPVFSRFHAAFDYSFDRSLLRSVSIPPSEGEGYVWRIVRERQRRGGRLWRLKRAYKHVMRRVGRSRGAP